MLTGKGQTVPESRCRRERPFAIRLRAGSRSCPRIPPLRTMRGFTLIELIVATAILVILTTLAIPMARVTIKRQREHDLRQALW